MKYIRTEHDKLLEMYQNGFNKGYILERLNKINISSLRVLVKSNIKNEPYELIFSKLAKNNVIEIMTEVIIPYCSNSNPTTKTFHECRVVGDELRMSSPRNTVILFSGEEIPLHRRLSFVPSCCLDTELGLISSGHSAPSVNYEVFESIMNFVSLVMCDKIIIETNESKLGNSSDEKEKER